ncbi:MAG: ABC transporter substrate-binding protein [Abitibacteriaceae bacterium]|nr:ABC transporter substrate-binding protein [Abditibacteriaceae bacterium]MBV9866289.1 ABC transporter substrate-binding protein [Abditibacteriaceae bacterium]
MSLHYLHRLVAGFWLGAALAVALNGCSRATPESGQITAVPQPNQGLKGNLTALGQADDLGREIKLNGVAGRVAIIGPGATEALFVMGAGAALVGRDQYTDYPPAALKAPVIGDYTGPFPEKVVAVRPDLVILQGETWDKARLDAWQQKCGVPVANLKSNSLEQVAQDIERLGAWVGAGEKAQQVAAPLRRPYPDIIWNTAFFEVQRSPLMTAGQGTLLNNMMQAAAMHNVADKVKGYKQYSLEDLAAKPPDIYIVAEQKPDKARVLRELRQQPGLRDLPCIKLGRVIDVPADWVERPGPRLGQGIDELVRQAKPFLPPHGTHA